MSVLNRLMQAFGYRGSTGDMPPDAEAVIARRHALRQVGVASLVVGVPLQAVAAAAQPAAAPAPPATSFKLAAGGAVPRTLSEKFSDDVDAKDFGAKGDGHADDTAAILAALTYVKSQGGGTVTLGQGTYLISSAVPVPEGCNLQGKSTLSTRILAAGADCKVIYSSNSGLYDFRFDGAGKAATGIVESGSLNRASIARLRIEHCTARGFSCGSVGQVNNSTFMDIFSQFNPVNFHVENALNCSFICCNGNLRSSKEGGLPGDRNIRAGVKASTGNGTCRNTTFIKGIFERGDASDYSVEILENSNLGFHSVEFNSGTKAKILLNGGDVNIFEPHFTLGKTDIAIAQGEGGGTAWLYGPPSIAGRENRSDRALFDCAVMQDGRPGCLAFAYAGPTVARMLGAKGSATKKLVRTATLIETPGGEGNRIVCAASRGEEAGDEGVDLLDYEVFASQVSGKMDVFHDNAQGGGRTKLGTLAVGANHFYLPSGGRIGEGLSFASADATKATATLKSISLRVI